MRRNVPITTPRGAENGNGQARPGRFAGNFTQRAPLGYFAAVGSGGGLSDSELR